MSLAIRMLPEPVRSLAFGSISGTYAGIGTSFSNAIRIIFVQNLTDSTLMFSLNGIDDHFPLPANGFLLLDVTANKTLPQGAFIAEGTRIYVKEVGAPSMGNVYVSTFYGTTT
jgi:hypothetical protein